MTRIRLLVIGALSSSLMIGFTSFYVSSGTTREARSALAQAMAAEGAPKLVQMYERFAELHEAQGGDRNVSMVLGRTDVRGHGRSSDVRSTGTARLDVIDGSVSVRMPDLPQGSEYRVWLIDNRPGEHNSVMADRSDLYVDAGRLEQRDNVWELDADLGPDTFRQFQVDVVAITRADEHPTDGMLVKGTPNFFQRLYTSLRTPELMQVSDYATPEAAPSGGIGLGVPSALAARVSPRKPIEVDPTVVLDNLVQLGADVFINENFDGNGRTCETCHPFLNNITTDPSEIARRPDNDPIFVAEFNPALAPGAMGAPLDIPVVLRQAALIGIPDDGLDKPNVNRAVPHLFAVNLTSGPAAPVVLPFGAPGAPPTPFPLPNPSDPNDPARAFGLDITLPPAGPGLPGGQAVPGAGFPAFGFTVDNATVPPIDRLGFGGDLGFAPDLGLLGRLGDAVPGAVVLLLTKTPARIPGQDFRFPTPTEVDAVVAFYLTLGRNAEMNLDALRLSSPIAERGRQIFTNPGGVLANFPGGAVIPVSDSFGNPVGAGKCNVCHNNAGARSQKDLFDNICAGLAQMLGLPVLPQCGQTNFNFETGVERLPSQPAVIVAGSFSAFGPPNQSGRVAVDGGFGNVPHIPGGTPADVAAGRLPCFNGNGGFGSIIGLDFPFTNPPVLAGTCTEEFNTPPLVEAADTGPFFHNNNAATIEGAVEFYNTAAFRNSSGGIILGAITDGVNGITLENTEVQAVASFLRVINSLENIRSARSFAQTANQLGDNTQFRNLLDQAIAQLEDASMVLEEAKLNARQADQIGIAAALLRRARGDGLGRVRIFFRVFVAPNGDVDDAIRLLDQASAGLTAS